MHSALKIMNEVLNIQSPLSRVLLLEIGTDGLLHWAVIAQLVLQISKSLPFVIWEQWNFPFPDTRLDSRLENHINVLLLYHKILQMSESDPDIAKCRARRDHTLAHFRTLRITSLTPISQPLLNPIGALRVHGFRLDTKNMKILLKIDDILIKSWQIFKNL